MVGDRHMVDSLHALLAVKERLQHNLGGNQIASIIDTLLLAAVRPIVYNTNYIDHLMAELFTPVFTNRRRKYSNVERAEFIDKLFTYVVTPSKHNKKNILSMLRLERNILFDALSDFFTKTKNYNALYLQLWTTTDSIKRSELLKQLQAIEQSVHLVKGKNLYVVIRNSTHYLDQASNFKGMVIEKYIRHAYRESEKAIKQTKLQISQIDLFKNLLLSVSKAIDKYDHNQGALTSYINWWFKDGVNQSDSSHEDGIAYTIPSVQRRKMQAANKTLHNFYTDLESLTELADTDERANVEYTMINQEQMQRMVRLISKADVHGKAMLLIGIQYVLDDDEKELLANTLVRKNPK